MSQLIPSEEHIVDALLATPAEHELHMPPLLPLLTLPTVIMNTLHPQHLPQRPMSPS
jgi:hypothetical protein